MKRPARALAAVGVLAALSGVAAPALRAAPAETSNRVTPKDPDWLHKVFLNIEGETIDDLRRQITNQLLAHMVIENDLEDEPLSAFAEECTLEELQHAIGELFRFKFHSRRNFESTLFVLTEDPKVRRALLADDPAPGKKPGKKPAPVKAASAPPVPAPPVDAAADAELRKPLAIPEKLIPIRQSDLFLPAIQQRLAKIAGIRILSDYADRTEECLGDQDPEAFFRSLDGMPLREALDKIASQFDYTWRKSRGWYLFQSRTWKADRRARIVEAMQAEDEPEETTASAAAP